MKRLVVLLILVAVLAVTAVVLHFQRGRTLSGGAGPVAASRDLVFPDLPVNDLDRIEVRDDDSGVTLVRGEDRWHVVERDRYPASIDRVRQLVLDLDDLKVSGRQQVGATALAETGLLRPGESEHEEETGIEVRLAVGDDVAADFVLGAQVRSTGGGRSPMAGMSSQRLLRTAEDGDTVWLVTKTFSNLSGKPADWIDKSFFRIAKPKSITVTRPEADQSWSVARDDETADFVSFADSEDLVKEDRRSGLKFVLSSPSFRDVIAPDEAPEDLMADASRAVIETFEGFTYTIDFVERRQRKESEPREEEDADEDGPGADNGAGEDNGEVESKWYVMLDIQAELPEQRQPGDEEDDETAARLDEQFATERERLLKKLDEEQRFNGWIYEVSEFTVAVLNRDREEMVKEPGEEEETEQVSEVPELQDLFERMQQEIDAAEAAEAGETAPDMAPDDAPDAESEAAPDAAPEGEAEAMPEGGPEAAPEAEPGADEPATEADEPMEEPAPADNDESPAPSTGEEAPEPAGADEAAEVTEPGGAESADSGESQPSAPAAD